MPPKFFITHSHKDNEFAVKLTNDLRAHGLDGFFDVYSIQPGDIISKRINDGLERCDIYVPILSHTSLKSPWCEEEIHAAITLSKLPGRNGRPRIISILVEDCQDAMPILLRTRLYIMFDGQYAKAFNDLLTKGFGVTLPTASPQSAPEISKPSPQIIVPPPPQVQTPPRSIINPQDGKEMILIPAGEFTMGSNDYDREKPPHQVYLDPFYISRYPVTNTEYKKFVDATKHDVPFRSEDWAKSYNWDKQNRTYPQGKENHPVVLVSWNDAADYCKWAGVRLPTEAEWEKAASWDDAKKEKRVYPWGKDFDSNKCNAANKIGGTTPVGKYSPHGDSAYGIADLAGNVWEWCADWYGENYYKNSPKENPQGSDSGQFRILRGGSWYDSSGIARCADRVSISPDYRNGSIGFRVAESLP